MSFVLGATLAVTLIFLYLLSHLYLCRKEDDQIILDQLKKYRVNKKIYTPENIKEMDQAEFENFRICLEAKTYKLLGINYKEYVKVYEDEYRNIVIEWL